MFKKRVLINTGNIHAGGALQVAISFLTEMINSDVAYENVTFLISSKIASEINPDVVTNSKFPIIVKDFYGFNCFFSVLNLIQSNYDVVFTLFGPKYTYFKANIDIVGFAQPWIIDFANPICNELSFSDRLRLRIKYKIQEFFFKRSDHIVVELEHVKESLLNVLKVNSDKVSVVYNTLSGLYLNKDSWYNLNFDVDTDYYSIGLISRAYPHKNIKILPEVSKVLRDFYNLKVKFYLTLTEDEWSSYKNDFGEFGVSVGPLTVYQCPSFYNKMDAIIFPSLLECFSATPLEALFMQKPLFASDRGFVRDVCKEYAIYFDPLDPNSIASSIASFINSGYQSIDTALAKNYILNFSSSKGRCDSYVNIIKKHSE